MLEVLSFVRERVADEVPLVLATVVAVDGAAGTAGTVPGATWALGGDGTRAGSLGDESLEQSVEGDAADALGTGSSGVRRYGGVTVFLHVVDVPPRLVVVGAADVSGPLVSVGKVLGFRVVVCDARPAFVTRTRFPDADELVADWPNRYLASIASTLGPKDAVCVLTHDAKFDVPALATALETRAGYVGAMGSRRTHADRVARLRAAGVADEDVGRVMAPIGLDLGGRTPAEVAVAIGAEIVAVRCGASAPSLRDGAGPIHRESGPR
ncbi:MAG: XdhC/CoxI family protein [Actinomycetota bacterium]|nr:XdhC/CoxI family protein [Actinomycetota bacterium]